MSEALEQKVEHLTQEVESLTDVVRLLLDSMVIQQKDFCKTTGVSPQTIRNKVIKGDLELLQADGSRKNFFKISKVAEIKPRKVRK